ncbi:MAG: hypothetical protein Q7T80_19070 [Methanoregula sp.]|nr:hypothetical protein [Methanoregula sp.]
MVELDVTQAEAEALIAMPKIRANDEIWNFPGPGGSVTIPLVSESRRENFLLDISRGQINLLKGTYQNRARQVVILVRLDLAGSPHRNPDDTVIPCPHLHLYKEGFGDKWACPLAPDTFNRIDDRWETLQDFMNYCNITHPPNLHRGLL